MVVLGSVGALRVSMLALHCARMPKLLGRQRPAVHNRRPALLRRTCLLTMWRHSATSRNPFMTRVTDN